ncbi:MAG: hypothetical protein EB166_09585, partial [Thaumarchaeota archaeon]|nr:hypothetical protein [Nitrososphaerota archaeon]
MGLFVSVLLITSSFVGQVAVYANMTESDHTKTSAEETDSRLEQDGIIQTNDVSSATSMDVDMS